MTTRDQALSHARALVADLERDDYEAALSDVCDAAEEVWDLYHQPRHGLEHIAPVAARVMADLKGKVRG